MAEEREAREGGRESQVNGGGGGEETEPLGLTVLASTFGEKLLEHSLIQTFPREHVPQPCTAVSC